jgi:hypothetical protein
MAWRRPATQVASDFDICTNVACDSIVIQTYGDQRLVRRLWVVLQKLNGHKATVASAAMTWPYRHVKRDGQLREKLNYQPRRRCFGPADERDGLHVLSAKDANDAFDAFASNRRGSVCIGRPRVF